MVRMAVLKREVRGCIEHASSMREYILSVMRTEPQLRSYLEPLIRKDLNSLADKLAYIEDMAEANT
jgi:hypothetical protein